MSTPSPIDLNLSLLPTEILVKIFWKVEHLPILFRVSWRIYAIAYQTLTRRLPLEEYNPLREIYIQMISFRAYVDDWQLRIIKNNVLSEIESRKNNESSDYEEWLLYNDDRYDDPDEIDFDLHFEPIELVT